jgi:hypothetical protein
MIKFAPLWMLLSLLSTAPDRQSTQAGRGLKALDMLISPDKPPATVPVMAANIGPVQVSSRLLLHSIVMLQPT